MSDDAPISPNQTVAHWLAPPITGEERPGPHSTYKPTADVVSETLSKMAVAVRAGSTVSLERTLGVGGMGEVHLARQEPLGRKVAAKRLRDPNPERELALLQEARILGHLEHPNVVPIHDVTVDEDDRLLLLLKRIEGEDWTHWLRPGADVCGQFEVDDPLYWHLEVLLQVCRAVEFAHDRGVVHRDLKPDNVRVGRFGEVVLVDWGIALGLPGCDIAPPVATATVAGTPVYMAPEMLTEPTRIDARTDVYQLGGLLFHILAGHAPHEQAKLPDIVSHALEWDPAVPRSVPDELGAIAVRALSRLPADRQPSATAFRQELQRFLSHRGSVQLTDDADERMVRAADPAALERARFGYTAALAQWTGNRRARTGLIRSTEALIALRLEQDDVAGAERLLAELDAPDADLAARVTAARAEQDRLAAIARRADPTLGASSRWTLASVMGLVWLSIPLIGHGIGRDRIIDASILLNWSLALWFATWAAALWFRRHALASELNRQVFGWVLLTPPLQVLLTYALDRAQVSADHIQALHFFFWGTMCATGSLGIDWRFAASAVAYLIGFLVVLQHPEQRYLVMFVPNLLLTLTVGWLYRTGSR